MELTRRLQTKKTPFRSRPSANSFVTDDGYRAMADAVDLALFK